VTVLHCSNISGAVLTRHSRKVPSEIHAHLKYIPVSQVVKQLMYVKYE